MPTYCDLPGAYAHFSHNDDPFFVVVVAAISRQLCQIMPRTLDDVFIQQPVINYVVEHLPREEVHLDALNYKVGKLESVLRQAKEQICPTASTRTLRRWWIHFLLYGDVPAAIRKWRRNKYRRRYASLSSRGGWTPEKTMILQGIVDENPQFYLDEIQDEFQYQTGETHSTSYLWKKLILEVGYSLQVATDKATQQEREQVQEYLDELGLLLGDTSQLVFVDESAKDRNSSRRRRSWSKKGQTPFQPAYLAQSSSNRYTLIAACDVNGFIVEACETVLRERGAADRDPTRGTVDGERFKLWVEQKLVPLLGKYDAMEPRSIVVLDNASVHNDVEAMIEEAGAIVVYLAPYSPEYNPIELMFHQYKACLRRNNDLDWLDAHLLGLESVTPANARNCFRKAQIPGREKLVSDTENKEEQVLTLALCAVALGVIIKKNIIR